MSSSHSEVPYLPSEQIDRLVMLLHALDALPLECDGLTRAISTLMQRDDVEHCIHVGRVQIEGVGTIPYHWWITLPDGRLCDLRARMWLGNDEHVPHGIFAPQEHQQYQIHNEVEPASIRLAPSLFYVLTSKPLDAFETWPEHDKKITGESHDNLSLHHGQA